MPFTPAHPAIILPLTRYKQFSTTALIAGSIVPDFEFFFQMRATDNIGHQWYGIVLFDLPVALLLCYVFHSLLRNLFIYHLPVVLQKKFANTTNFNWREYAAGNKAIVLVSLLTGIVSHLIWDGFTHSDGLFVEIIPALSQKTEWPFLNIPIYFLLQLVFSMVGLLVIIYVVYTMPSLQTTTTHIISKYYWTLLLVLIGCIYTLRIIVVPQYNSLGELVIAAMGSIMYGWLLTSVFFKYYLLNKISL